MCVKMKKEAVLKVIATEALRLSKVVENHFSNPFMDAGLSAMSYNPIEMYITRLCGVLNQLESKKSILKFIPVESRRIVKTNEKDEITSSKMFLSFKVRISKRETFFITTVISHEGVEVYESTEYVNEWDAIPSYVHVASDIDLPKTSEAWGSDAV